MRRLIALALGFASVSCTVGDGTGSVRGRLQVAVCSLDVPDWSLNPNFFAGEWHQGSYMIRLSRGGDTGEYNDALEFLVDDTSYIARHLNERLPVGAPGVTPVHAVLRLAKTCGRTELVLNTPEVAMEAWRGYVVFEAIYGGDPTAESPARRTSVSSFSIALRDPRVTRDYYGSTGERAAGEGREPRVLSPSRAELEGSFEFYFSRGRPAQSFQ